MTSTHPFSFSRPAVKAVLFVATQALVLILLYMTANDGVFGELAAVVGLVITGAALLVLILLPALFVLNTDSRNVRAGIKNKGYPFTRANVLAWLWLLVHLVMIAVMVLELNRAHNYPFG
jgi:lipoprotein signal peptidase